MIRVGEGGILYETIKFYLRSEMLWRLTDMRTGKCLALVK